jgi:hypothetical protein
MNKTLLAFSIAAMLAPVTAANADIIGVPPTDWTGVRTKDPGGIDGSGNWLANPITLSWVITRDAGTGVYSYTYTFTHAPGETSHFILQISDGKTLSDFQFSSTGGGAAQAPTTYGNGGNPGMPHSFYGIKFDGTSGNTTVIAFNTTLDPIWGSFYAKDGMAGGLGQNAAWNTGLNNSTRPDVGTTDFRGWIATPDGAAKTVPEPGTMLLLGGGMLGIAASLRRRFDKR